jgi:hypothetical protein
MLLPKNNDPKRPLAIAMTPTEIIVTLANGSIVVNPLSWHPWLEQATSEQRVRYELGTYDIQWPELGQCLDIEGMIRGVVPNSFATY